MPALPRPSLVEATASESALRRFLHGLPGVDQVGAEARVADLGTRSIKKASKLFALDLAIAHDRPHHARGRRHARQGAVAVRQGPASPTRRDPSVPSVRRRVRLPRPGGAWPTQALRGSGVKVASVATAFPSGRAALDVKLADVRSAVDAGADEIDMVIDRGAFLAGRYGAGVRGDPAGEGGLRPGPPQGHPGDRRAGHPRQRAAGVVARHARRRRLHQDLDRARCSRRPRCPSRS